MKYSQRETLPSNLVARSMRSIVLSTVCGALAGAAAASWARWYSQQVDLAVGVLVHFHAYDARAIHVALGVDLAVVVAVVFELLQLSGGVVLRPYAIRAFRL